MKMVCQIISVKIHIKTFIQTLNVTNSKYTHTCTHLTVI